MNEPAPSAAPQARIFGLRLAMAINRGALPAAGVLLLLAAGGALARLGG